MVVGFFIGGRCYPEKWVPGMGLGYKEKTALHSFREVVVEFVFRKLKLVREC